MPVCLAGFRALGFKSDVSLLPAEQLTKTKAVVGRALSVALTAMIGTITFQHAFEELRRELLWGDGIRSASQN
jgi:hypothetical protein